MIIWKKYGKVAEIVACCNISKVCCYFVYHLRRRQEAQNFAHTPLWVSFDSVKSSYPTRL